MRIFLLVLIFANVVFWGWSQGYLGDIDNGREPQRLGAQLNPGKLRIVSISKPPVTEALETCRAIANLRLTEAEKLQLALAKQLSSARVNLLRPERQPTWEVSIGGLANQAVVDSKLAELKRLGIEGTRVVAENQNGFSLVLASLLSEAAAQEQLQAIVKKGVKSARVVIRAASDRVRLLVRGPEVVIARLPELTGDLPSAALTNCPVQ